jgi:hAT family C-terminal dimerisation region
VTQYCTASTRQYSQKSSNDSAGLNTTAIESASEPTEPGLPMNKKSKSSLFEEYDDSDDQMAHPCTSLAAQINQYLGTKVDQETNDCLSFWMCNRKTFHKLFVPAIVALSIPASSAPMERLFSYSGMFCRPYRSRVSDANLERLTYLKCNSK